MSEAAVRSSEIGSLADEGGHSFWVRICHWIVALSFFALAFSGFFILMVQPRLYWGEVGNDLTPALLELPISNNHRPEGWEQAVRFTDQESGPISATRSYEAELFNENGWARSLHFLAAWFFVIAGAFYAFAGLITRHIWRDLLPRTSQMTPSLFWQDLKRHLRLDVASTAKGGPPYGLLQKCTYVGVAFFLLPFMLLTGLTMSPRVTAAFPILLDVFGGYQSARTLHFFCFATLALFVVVHVAMVFLTGFRKQLRAMTLGD